MRKQLGSGETMNLGGEGKGRHLWLPLSVTPSYLGLPGGALWRGKASRRDWFLKSDCLSRVPRPQLTVCDLNFLIRKMGKMIVPASEGR